MSKIFLYGRVSTSQQTLEQQERTAYEWLKAHGMSVDEVVTDEGVSGGVSYADRNLGKVLLPKMQEGDMIIVSEVSRLGRSMYDLSKLIHTELKPRKLRLVVACMGIDLNCAKITPIDQLILSNFAFAAELEKHLIRERTLSALAVKKQQGVKLGGAAGAWIESFNKKSKEQIDKEYMIKGKMKNERYLESKDVKVFLKIIKNVFPDACNMDDARDWDWSKVTTRGYYRRQILDLMKTHKELDESGTLFARWDFSDLSSEKLRVRLCGNIQNVRKSLEYNKKIKDNGNKES
jgi:DNA invertase Pin-like site-specific DNA recombinase